MIWPFRKPKPRRLTTEEKVASAASYLARHAAKCRADARKWAIRLKCAELREGGPSPIAPRDVVVAEVRLARTHCKRGHELSGSNLRINQRGARVCRECQKISKAAYLERKNG